VRVELDDRDETLGARVRQAQQRKVPYVVVVGDREAADGSVAVRLRGGEQLGSMARDRFVRLVSQVAQERRGELELST
jgi:threonyl-tRNA synthetase